MSKPEPKPETTIFSARLPTDLVKKVSDQAEKNRRSMTGEFIYRLEKSFELEENAKD